MAGADLLRAVADAGPIIHLGELGCLDLLDDFRPVGVTSEVWNEIAAHCPELTAANITSICLIQNSPAPSARLFTLAKSCDLHRGELAALSLLESYKDAMFFCDDLAARLVAESLGHDVHGTIGIVVRSIRRHKRSREQVLDLLRNLPRKSSLHVSTRLLATVIASVESAG